MSDKRPQFIVSAPDPKRGYRVYWTGTGYSRKREKAFRCDSLEFAATSAVMCGKELSYLCFEVQEA